MPIPKPPGNRCGGAPAFAWAPERRQTPSSNHPHTYGDARGPVIAGPARARSTDSPGARGGSPLAAWPVQGKLVAGSSTQLGQHRTACRISILRAVVRLAGEIRSAPSLDSQPSKARVQGGCCSLGPAWLGRARSVSCYSSEPLRPAARGGGDLRATKTQSCCAAPSWRIFYLVHCLLGSNTASRTTLSPRGWSRSSLLSSHGMTTSHSRHWIVWLSFAGQPCAVHCVQQSPQPSRVL